MIVGIDGGKPPKLACAWRANGPGWHVSGKPWVGSVDIAAAEKPEGVIRAARTPASVISPAGWGMAALFTCDAALRLWLPVEAWKEKLFPGRSKVKKAVFCANIVQRLGLQGLDPTNDADQDAIDAIGIARAVELLTPKELKKYTVQFRDEQRFIPCKP